MAETNQRLKAILQDARVICLSKYQVLEERLGIDDPDVIKIKQDLDTGFEHFNEPSIWMRTIHFQENEVMTFFLKIDGDDGSDVQRFHDTIHEFFDYLKERTEEPQSKDLELGQTTDFNLQVLDVLRQNQHKIRGRKQFFKNQGTDLDQHANFLKLQQHQDEVQGKYRQALETNAVLSKETDKLIFRNIGEAIQQADELDPFLFIYTTFTAAMKNKLPVPADPPVTP
ncbi:MAG: hypothetical protein R2824_05210 [Saprospiraceae bacterium]|nr:hypothetical protein [Lewinella sp.]